MIGIIDYGAGNLFSVSNALTYLGLNHRIIRGEEELRQADKLILPGVGAFPDAMRMLRERGLDKVIIEEVQRKPLLGICLGMQMLFEWSYEFEKTKGLGLIPGDVQPMEVPGLRVPHIGWNDVQKGKACPLSQGIQEGERFYFVHSYKAVTESEYISLQCDYGGTVPGLVFSGNAYGAQFHPEKSGEAGLRILKNFGEMEGEK